MSDIRRDDSRWPEPVFVLVPDATPSILVRDEMLEQAVAKSLMDIIGWVTLPPRNGVAEAKTKSMMLKPDVATPRGWLATHRPHGRVWYEVKIGDWHRWKCSCGDRFCFKDAERDADPNAYRL